MAKLTIQDLKVEGKRILMRVDFNVPLKDSDDGSQRIITDDTRIRAALPSIEYLLKNGGRVILMSHLGRPKGERKAQFSLKPAADRLSELLGAPVAFADDCIGDTATQAVDQLENGQVLLLENVRYHSEETENDPAFAAQLAAHGDIFINDAFGTAHRAHASTAGVTQDIDQCAMGFLVERELKYLQDELREPKRPFLVIMGGAKVSDKIQVITALLDKADAFIIGGGMAYTFRKAQGYTIGKSICEDDKIELALDILKQAEEKNTQFLLPADNLQADAFGEDANVKYTAPYAGGSGGIDDEWEGLDIGPVAIEEFAKVIATAGTIIWNGPMGVFEIDKFSKGTQAVAQAMAKSEAVTIIGGGDSVTAVNKYGLADQMTFISTGGGASLELLEGKTLPGIASLSDK
ncbi:MAG: phosphoglycerate kinase [Verrucomicrobiales bacterium]|nr:phosphoglycerate kinase [Verrucomicrobiales bacterium]